VVVLGANWVGLPSVSDDNPTQFGHQRPRGAAGATTTADSFPSVMLFAPPQAHEARGFTDARA
jgi:hypothetical protein